MSAGFIGLLDNYERSLGVAEQVTAEEQTEINLFLDAVLQTEVMKVYLNLLQRVAPNIKQMTWGLISYPSLASCLSEQEANMYNMNVLEGFFCSHSLSLLVFILQHLMRIAAALQRESVS